MADPGRLKQCLHHKDTKTQSLIIFESSWRLCVLVVHSLRACLKIARNPSLRGAKRRSNPSNKAGDCFAPLAMTGFERSFSFGE